MDTFIFKEVSDEVPEIKAKIGRHINSNGYQSFVISVEKEMKNKTVTSSIIFNSEEKHGIDLSFDVVGRARLLGEAILKMCDHNL